MEFRGVKIIDADNMDLLDVSKAVKNEIVLLRDSQNKAMDALRVNIIHNWNMGQLLCRAKWQVQHGDWIQWLEDHDLSVRTANRQMRLFRIYPTIEDVQEFESVHKALEAVINPQRPRPEHQEEYTRNEEEKSTDQVDEEDIEVVEVLSSSQVKKMEEESLRNLLREKEEDNERLRSINRTYEEQSNPHESQRVKEVQAANNRAEEANAQAQKNAILRDETLSELKRLKDLNRKMRNREDKHKIHIEDLQRSVDETKERLSQVGSGNVNSILEENERLHKLVDWQEPELESLHTKVNDMEDKLEKLTEQNRELSRNLNDAKKYIEILKGVLRREELDIPDMYGDLPI